MRITSRRSGAEPERRETVLGGGGGGEGGGAGSAVAGSYTAALGGASTGKEGSGPVQLGGLPSPCIVKERTGTDQLHVKRRRGHLPGGGVGQGNQTLCVQLSIFSNFIL